MTEEQGLDSEKVIKVLKKIEQQEYADLEPENVLRAFDEPRKTKFASIPQTTGEFLAKLVKQEQAKQIFEIGCSAGYSTLWLALGVIESGPQGAEIWTTEINSGKLAHAKENFAEAGTQKLIKLVPFDAVIALGQWQKNHPGQKLDLIFIDAYKKDYYKYFEQALPILKNGGMMIFDNYYSHRQLMAALESRIKISHGISSATEALDNGLLIIQKHYS